MRWWRRTRPRILAGHDPRTPVEQATAGDLRRGRQHMVYRRDRQPCRRCGTRILVDQQGPEGQERTTFWCPTCQRSQ